MRTYAKMRLNVKTSWCNFHGLQIQWSGWYFDIRNPDWRQIGDSLYLYWLQNFWTIQQQYNLCICPVYACESYQYSRYWCNTNTDCISFGNFRETPLRFTTLGEICHTEIHPSDKHIYIYICIYYFKMNIYIYIYFFIYSSIYLFIYIINKKIYLFIYIYAQRLGFDQGLHQLSSTKYHGNNDHQLSFLGCGF